MNILVTGGAGFIGSHIADACVAKHMVTVLDDLSCGKQTNVPAAAQFVPVSVTDPTADLAAIFARGKFDLVYHCAAQKSVRLSFADPVHDADVNILGLIRVLECCRRFGVQSVVFLSSGGTAYGDTSQLPAVETSPLHPLSPYAVSKVAGEYYLDYYSHHYGMRCVTLRLANVYGPRQDPQGEAGVVAIFFSRLLQGQPLRIYGDGTQTRDYVHVLDVVAACQAVAHGLDAPGSYHYNIGTGIETSVNQLAKMAEEITAVHAPRQSGPLSAGELTRSCLDSHAFQEQFGWRPQFAVQRGLEQTFAWFREQ